MKVIRTKVAGISAWLRLMAICLLSLCIAASRGEAQMVTGKAMPGYDTVFGLSKEQQSKDYTVVQIASSLGANVLWPGETASFTFRFTNTTDQPLRATGRVEVIGYATRVLPGDIWVPNVFKVSEAGSVPITVDLPAKGWANVTVTPPIPARFGGYALVINLGAQGRAFGAAVARTVAADVGKVQLPTFALDMPWPFEMSETVTRTFKRLGTKACRMGASYTPTTSPNFERDLAQLTQFIEWAGENDISVMLTVGAGSAPQPLGRGRPWLNEDNSMKQGVKEDLAWLPEYDADFQKWCKIVASRFGWPKGPVNAIELWNEPWEGVSISGWGADLPRYREMYEHMANGIIEARREAGVKVLIGGASSSSNTIDKLFPDGSAKFLPMLDFVSIHYQEMSATPSLMPEWMNRKGEYGRVKVWDTESWVANSEDRVAAVIASMRAQGQDRTVGIYGRNVYEPQKHKVEGVEMAVAQAWAPAAAVAATQKFIGQRAFKELLFKNGLPWVFVFDGLPQNPDSGSVVVVGDLGGVYNRNRLLFRSVLGLKNVAGVAAVQETIAALPADAPEAQRKQLTGQLAAATVLDGASLTLANPRGQFLLYDFYGNPVPAPRGAITVPLNGLGYFLRTNGARGSFARLLQAIRTARIEGYEPLDVMVADMTAPIARQPVVKVTLTNILNRAVQGMLRVKLEGLTLAPATTMPLRLAAHETRTLEYRVVQGSPAPDNTYPLALTFDAGADGRTTHEEALHVNFIAKRAIKVDGNLDDWQGVLPQPVSGAGIRANVTETAWLPFKNFDVPAGKGLASGYLAYDANSFYFAAKIADETPDAGSVRFETRDDDRYYYPAKVTDRDKELTWPAGVRRFSYRTDPDLPSGNDRDNVQIAFNVIPLNKESWAANPPGTMPRFMAYRCTDYEYALNSVAPAYGGGTEIWRMLVPGMPRKHFYPRQPKSPLDGAVKSGALAMRRDGNTRLVECALPWSEIPLVKQRLDAGQMIKFSFRVNDNGGNALELATNRSVSKDNILAFHNDWATHWANELEFGVEK